MKKRLDMVEQLVDNGESYAHFEQAALEKITGMRTSLASADARDIGKIDRESRGAALRHEGGGGGGAR